MIIDGYNHGITLIRRDMGPLFYYGMLWLSTFLTGTAPQTVFYMMTWGSKIMNHWILESWGLQVAIHPIFQG